jgi:hypothetical protein
VETIAGSAELPAKEIKLIRQVGNTSLPITSVEDLPLDHEARKVSYINSLILRANKQLWAIFVVKLRAVHRGQSDWSKVPNKVKKELAEVSLRICVVELEADCQMVSMVIAAVDA